MQTKKIIALLGACAIIVLLAIVWWLRIAENRNVPAATQTNQAWHEASKQQALEDEGERLNDIEQYSTGKEDAEMAEPPSEEP